MEKLTGLNKENGFLFAQEFNQDLPVCVSGKK